MPMITIDEKQIECREGIPVLQAALEAGWDVPHYCYHPGLSVVASCRLCLMEMKLPHPQTKELGWVPKLFPSCQTPVRDGMEVRFNSDFVQSSQKHVMEYYLINHPLDCPVCDKAGECGLQDYSEKFGNATSRMVEDKHKNPKKDIGSHTLLYSDRCILCSRCVRFCDEISGTGELAIVDRGSRGEIDVFPGVPLENELQGNVVDLCPVGALLDKDFLFKQRVWELHSARSISPANSGGHSIWIDYNDQGVHRIRPRYNPRTNEWWIADEDRFGWKYVHGDERLGLPRYRENGDTRELRWETLPAELRTRFEQAASGGPVAAVLSPMMSCEEAWLLVRFVRAVASQATLVLGPVPVEGEDKTFPKGFVLPAEKCPNRRGIECILKHAGGSQIGFDKLVAAAGDGKFKAAYVVGGYANAWLTSQQEDALAKIDCLVLHDLLHSSLADRATITIPGCSWVEREGSFMSAGGVLQAFERAIVPLEGLKSDGQFFYELAGESGLFRAAKLRERMALEIGDFADVYVAPELPEHAH